MTHSRAAWATRLLLVGVVVLIVVAVIRAYRRIDLDDVWQALGHLEWWHVPVLLGVLVLRQVLNAAPLAIYVPGAGFYRATINDLGAATASSFAPPRATWCCG